MAFSVAIDWLLIGMNGVTMIVPADKVTLSPPKLKRNWDVKPGFGVQGAFCVYTGEGLATFDATFEFWNEEKEVLWDAFANVFLTAPKGVKPGALGIYHPVLVKPPFRIQNVQVTDIEGFGLVSPGKWQTRLTFLEYRPPLPFVPKKTEPVVPAVEKAPPAKPKTEQDLRMVAAQERLKAAVAAGTQ
ncbi:hypothetical protein EON82_23340 [bacterium]|nr:MAG: hypothetical protein EON82_23340 [bacterium]